MASPLRPDPEERRREYEALERERMARRAAAGAGFAWWWAFWIVIIALAIWWAGWGWGGTGGWWWGSTAAAPAYAPNGAAGSNGTAGTNGGAGTANANNGSNQAAISGPGQAVLNASDKNAFVGKHFQVNNVPVQSKINNQVLWIGSNNTTPMLVILAGNGDSAANAHVDNGSIVNVTGTVEKAPPRALAKNQWSLSGNDADRLEHEGVYIRATQVQAVHP